jgi:hypothetical protein
MPKTVLPIHLDQRDRAILRLAAESGGVSMAEVIRRQIRALPFEPELAKPNDERPAGE